MSSHIQFTSPELKLHVDTPAELFTSIVDDWRISEHYEPNRYHLGSERFGSYRVLMEFEVSKGYECCARGYS